jgi:F-type H+-transporting ATPase subunit gamma
MPSLIDIRRRIRSVKNTQQITKAMKMVSAAKLRRAQDRVIASRPYGGLLRKVLENVAAAVSQDERTANHPLLAHRPENRSLLILITSDKGLSGAFNSNLIKAAQAFIVERSGSGHSGVGASSGSVVRMELIGRKGRDFFRKRKAEVTGEHLNLAAKVKFEDTAAIAQKAMELYRNEEIDAVWLVYNEFKSVVAQKLVVRKVLPIQFPENVNPPDYIYEEPPAEILASLLPRYVEIEIYRALLEGTAAEHAARMTAMDAATSNAGDMIEKLTLYMNRVRQASITKEIIEVVSGAAAAE